MASPTNLLGELRSDPATHRKRLMNALHNYKDNFRAYMLYKLCERKDVYDWKFGMDYTKFGDVVVGIQHNREADFRYCAFQLTNSSDQTKRRTFNFNHILKESDNSGKRKAFAHSFNPWKTFESSFTCQQDVEMCQNMDNLVIFTNWEFTVPRQHTIFIEDVAEDDPIRSLVPPMKDGRLVRLSQRGVEEIMTEWKAGGSICQAANVHTEDLLKKVIIASKQPFSHVIHSFGRMQVKEWDLLKCKCIELKSDHDFTCLSKTELMKTKVSFQGQRTRMCDVVDVPDSDLLLRLIVGPELISVGAEIEGLGDTERLYIERTFVKTFSQNKRARSEQELLDERLVIIEGAPGLGKTVALKHAAKRLKETKTEHTWVIHLTCPFEVEGTGPDSLVRAVTKDSKLDRACLRYFLQKTDCIALFIDGLDEANAEQRNCTYTWVLSLLSRPFIKCVWISARSQLENELRRAFPDEERYYTLTPFTIIDQIKFLQAAWNVNERETSILHTFAAMLRHRLELCEIDSLMDLPLITMMVGEMYEDEFRCFKTNHGKSNNNFIELTESMVESMIQRQITKNFVDVTTNQFQNVLSREIRHIANQHGLISVYHKYHTFPDFARILSRSEKQSIDDLLDHDTSKPSWLINSAFITRVERDNIVFSHQLFAEYFAAKWLFDKLTQLGNEEESFGERPVQLKLMTEFLKKHRPERNVKVFIILMVGKECEGLLKEWCPSRSSCNKYYLLKEFMDFDPSSEYDAMVRKIWLFTACYNGDTNLAKSVLDNGANVNSATDRGHTPLHFAVNDRVEMVSILCQALADVNLKDSNGSTPLHMACRLGHLEIAQLLLEKSADVDVRDALGRTPLHYASKYQADAMMAKVLLEFGSNVNAIDSDRERPLHYACLNGHADLVKTLLCHGADPNEADKDRRTPLHQACEIGNSEIVEMLIENGSMINADDKEGKTPLHIACQIQDNEKCVRLLLENGSNINAVDKKKETPLHYACSRGNFEMAYALLEYGADTDGGDNVANTPLHLACEIGHTETAELLLEKRSDVNLKDKDGNTPWRIACLKGRSAISQLFFSFATEQMGRNPNSHFPLSKFIQDEVKVKESKIFATSTANEVGREQESSCSDEGKQLNKSHFPKGHFHALGLTEEFFESFCRRRSSIHGGSETDLGWIQLMMDEMYYEIDPEDLDDCPTAETLEKLGYAPREAASYGKFIDINMFKSSQSLLGWALLKIENSGLFDDKGNFIDTSYPSTDYQRLTFTNGLQAKFMHFTEFEQTVEKVEVPDGYSLWFHGTTSQWVHSIADDGIKIRLTTGNIDPRDFSVKDGFYLHSKASFASFYCRSRHLAPLSIVIFMLENDFEEPLGRNGLDLRFPYYKDDDGKTIANEDCVSSNDKGKLRKWEEVIRHYRLRGRGRCSELDSMAFIAGPVSDNVSGPILRPPPCDGYQLCVRTEDLADLLTQRIVGVVHLTQTESRVRKDSEDQWVVL